MIYIKPCEIIIGPEVKQEWYLSSRKLEKEISQGKRNASVQAGENFSTESKSVHQVMECQ